MELFSFIAGSWHAAVVVVIGCVILWRLVGKREAILGAVAGLVDVRRFRIKDSGRENAAAFVSHKRLRGRSGERVPKRSCFLLHGIFWAHGIFCIQLHTQHGCSKDRRSRSYCADYHGRRVARLSGCSLAGAIVLGGYLLEEPSLGY